LLTSFCYGGCFSHGFDRYFYGFGDGFEDCRIFGVGGWFGKVISGLQGNPVFGGFAEILWKTPVGLDADAYFTPKFMYKKVYTKDL
jgi:hypothetical protein